MFIDGSGVASNPMGWQGKACVGLKLAEHNDIVKVTRPRANRINCCHARNGILTAQALAQTYNRNIDKQQKKSPMGDCHVTCQVYTQAVWQFFGGPVTFPVSALRQREIAISVFIQS